MREEKGKENPLKIVRFTDGSVACYQGTENEVKEKAKIQFPDKAIAVII